MRAVLKRCCEIEEGACWSCKRRCGVVELTVSVLIGGVVVRAKYRQADEAIKRMQKGWEEEERQAP